jgi:hypothetical protein
MTPCSMCSSQTSPSYFRVARVTPTGETPLALVCSVTCAIKWFYRYAQMNGLMLAMKAKSTFDSFIEGLKQLRG